MTKTKMRSYRIIPHRENRLSFIDYVLIRCSNFDAITPKICMENRLNKKNKFELNVYFIPEFGIKQKITKICLTKNERKKTTN